MKTRVLLLTLLISPLLGCSSLNSAYQESRELFEASQLLGNGEVTRDSNWVIPAQSSFYVARSNHLSSSNPEHANVLIQLLETAIGNSFSGVRIGLFPESADFALRSAQRAGSNYVVYPRLLRWDDRLGTWSEIMTSLRQDSNQDIVDGFGLDQALVQLIIIDANSGKQVDLARIESASGWLSLYGDDPATILLPSLMEYFSSLRV